MNEIKFAVTAWRLDEPSLAGELARQAEIAEALGFHSFWLPESHFGDAHSIPSPLMLLAAVAARTRQIKLGSTSYLLPIRHPLQAAEEVAVLDRLSGGRVILGVGRGVQDAMFHAFNVATKDKRKMFKTNLEIMINAWCGAPVAYLPESQEPVTLAPLPMQHPHPPIWIAAFGPLAIKQAGSLGLPYLASPIEPLGKLVKNYERHTAFANEAGHESINVVPIMRTLYVSNNRFDTKKIRQALAVRIPHAMLDEGAEVEDWAIIGDTAYVRDKLAEYAERLGMTHLIARGRIPGVNDNQQVKSLEVLAHIASDLSADGYTSQQF
ncbi:MAG: LLM class flavin-dependent oxidoreductase [Pseudomonadales bacterium]